jgi:chromosome segregation ATPase
MEDREPIPSTTPPPAARTAQALRELHDRARTALAAQRERMGQLEAQLTHQLDSIADTLAQQIASHGGSPGQAQQSLDGVEQLRAELEKTRLEWDREREVWQAERAQLVAADGDRSHALDERQRELESRQQTLDERATELNHQDREQRQSQDLIDAHAAQSAAKQSELFASENALEKRRAEIAELDARIQQTQRELDQLRDELKAREQAVERAETTLATERTALESQREEFDRRIQALSAETEHNESETAARLLSLEQQLHAERTAWSRERASVEEQRRLLAKERDDLATALEAARGELVAARAEAAAAGELESVKQQFDAAREDVLSLRTRVAEVEEELASRPVANETDSVELVHLRAEREAMTERIATLEQQCAAQKEIAATQEPSDLQRRFELAVDDVRELKQRIAELEDELQSAKSSGGRSSAPSVGGGSWEAMKKKMLANLEGEGEDVDEQRQEERATIQDTIRITEEALARKDRELAELKSRLAEAAIASPDRNEAVEQLIDADEIIAEHRARIAQLEIEITAKLREAELELSVERAKITRETAHLAELRAEIDSHRATGGDTHAGPGNLQHPKRRWLSKLGLNADEDEK